MSIETRMTREVFDGWLMFMDDYLEDFKSFVPEIIRTHLDHSIKSLDIIENWILQRYSTPQMLFLEPNKTISTGILCYVGETFRVTLKGIWNIHPDEPNFPFKSLPVIEGFSVKRVIICPSNLIVESIQKRVGWYLRATLKVCIDNANESKL